MVTFAFETKYSDDQIIGCIAPGVKLAGLLVRRYIGTSEVIVVLLNRKGEADTVRLRRGNGGRLYRSSDELAVMVMERRVQHVCVSLIIYNQQWDDGLL